MIEPGEMAALPAGLDCQHLSRSRQRAFDTQAAWSDKGSRARGAAAHACERPEVIRAWAPHKAVPEDLGRAELGPGHSGQRLDLLQLALVCREDLEDRAHGTVRAEERDIGAEAAGKQVLK